MAGGPGGGVEGTDEEPGPFVAVGVIVLQDAARGAAVDVEPAPVGALPGGVIVPGFTELDDAIPVEGQPDGHRAALAPAHPRAPGPAMLDHPVVAEEGDDAVRTRVVDVHVRD